jgi:ABC-type multidrug transport system ATPase subunit
MSRWVMQTFQLGHRYANGPAVLSSIDLNIRRGDICAIMGPSGCGKTTLLGLMAGLVKSREGRIEVFGFDPYRYRAAAASRVGIIKDINSEYSRFTVRENLEVVRRKYDLSGSRLNEVIELVGLGPVAGRPFAQLSTGMRRRLEIAAALMPRPELLILDEPSKGLDPPGKSWFISLLKDLNQNSGVTILITSHCAFEVASLATHVCIMREGRFAFQGSWNEMQMEYRPRLLIHTSDNNKAADVLRGYPMEITEAGLSVPYLDEYQTAMINRELVAHKLDVYTLRAAHGLEECFAGALGSYSLS